MSKPKEIPATPTDAGTAALPSGVTPDKAGDPNDPSRSAGTVHAHGSKSRDFIAPRSTFVEGPFGRLFRELPAWVPPGATDDAKVGVLKDLAQLMVESETDEQDASQNNPDFPAGYTYFGQFVDHDFTFDPASDLQKQNDPEQLHNFRTPRFDLDNLYGRGPDDMPYLFDRRSPTAGKFLIGEGRDTLAAGVSDPDTIMSTLTRTGEDDLPRNEQGVALVGDPRNDENIIVSQLQLAFLKLHNRFLDFVLSEEKLTGKSAFLRAQTLLRWHYQWVVLHDFLPRLIGRELVDELTAPAQGGGSAGPLRFFRWKQTPFMPVEFSAAAYRFGHSVIRPSYTLNSVVQDVPIFQPPASSPGATDDLRGFRPLPKVWTIDWRRFVPASGDPVPVQPSRRINTRLSRPLSAIPAGPGGSNPLAFLNLLRGLRLSLPSGQAVGRAMGVTRLLSAQELELDARRFGPEAPLWYYVLKEAEVLGAGQHLGPVGGRIVGEVFVGLAQEDPGGFLKGEPKWHPDAASGQVRIVPGTPGRLTLADLLTFADVMKDPFEKSDK